jgi:sarcosine oxidase
MSKTYDVIVLGLGGMGTAAAFELARRGRRVLGLEQFQIGHDRGSSHGSTRVIRKAYYEHPEYVPLLRRAYERWFDLEQRRGQHLFTICGCLSLSRPEDELASGVLGAAREHHLPVERLDAPELRRRFPAFHCGEDFVGVLEAEAGFLYVEDCVRAYADEARLLGADLHAEEPALEWTADANSVTVRTARDTYHAARLVITAGAWASRALSGLGLPLVVLRKVLFWIGTEDDSRFRRDRFPIYMVETPRGFYYGFPVIDRNGAKLGRHDGGDIVADPAKVNRNVALGEDADCREFLQAYLPQISGPLNRSVVCMYTVTPDRHFILDRHPEYPHIAIAAGFSGHGFKFASVVGEIMADLAELGKTELPIKRFRLERFHPG